MVTQKVQCIEDAWDSGKLAFKKGTEYPVTVNGTTWKTTDELGNIRTVDRVKNSNYFEQYFKEVN